MEKKTLINNIIGFITKQGKRELAKKFFYCALLKTSKHLNLHCQLILIIFFKRLASAIEVRNIKRKGNFIKIPFLITRKRQYFLSMK